MIGHYVLSICSHKPYKTGFMVAISPHFSGDLKVMAMVMMGVQQHSGGAICLIEMGC